MHDYTEQLYKRIAFVTKDRVRVNAYDYITSKQPNTPLNDLLVSYAHCYIARADNVPADTGNATVILEYANGKCVYTRSNGDIFGTSVLDDDSEEWVVTFKNAAKHVTHVEANEYDSFIAQYAEQFI
jgi:hypothetical protein